MITTMAGLVLAGLLAVGDAEARNLEGLSPEEKGRAIALEQEKQFDDHHDSTADMTMIIKKGEKIAAVRKMRLRVLPVPGDGEKVLFIFDQPNDLKGMVALLVSHKFEEDDLWFYFPERRRVKRTTSQTKGSRFMGSEWKNEDLARQEPEKFTYRWLRDDACQDLDCFVLERYPVEKNSRYSKQVLWMDKAQFRIIKMEYFDKKDVHVKTLEYFGYKNHLNRFWRWSEHIMTNHLTGENTRTQFENWKFNTGLPDSYFTVNGMKRAR